MNDNRPPPRVQLVPIVGRIVDDGRVVLWRSAAPRPPAVLRLVDSDGDRKA